LALYQLDRAALKGFSSELDESLAQNERARLAALLEIDADAFTRERLVDLFLLPETHPEVTRLFVALRQSAKRRALAPMFASDNPALEGRLREYDALRDDKIVATLLDKLLNPKRLPWYLRISGKTGGWIDSEERAELSSRLGRMLPVLTAELVAFAKGLDEIDGNTVLHDGLA
jgi:hypothetical protein